eukprot:gnl/MRDRNA2_/MRDRNA2_67099_c0_seq1.p1 gnl/MRDRNA2_/MRDRNA2_67099_c0~~gnl/MRDRNA2_/MRDRNA2_67099_c0_seq1.p1  ORF type:complete len:315 (+),score=55.76 gnl/MRDRNA2_/MRDRNA2_67099_c0_seq1:2-946(+)
MGKGMGKDIGKGMGKGGMQVLLSMMTQASAGKGKGMGKGSGLATDTWTCSVCGFLNKQANEVCGGRGAMGCKAPKVQQFAPETLGVIKPVMPGKGMKSGKGTKSGNGAVKIPEGAEQTECRFFTTGACSRGVNCFYIHDQSICGSLPGGGWKCGQCGFINKSDLNRVCGGKGTIGCKAPHPDAVGQMPAAMGVGVLGGNSASQHYGHKNLLQELVMKITRSKIEQGHIVYDTNKVKAGFQSTVIVPVLGGDFEDTGFTGEVRSTTKEAEQSAAEYAVEAIQSEPSCQLALSAAAASPIGKGGRKGGKGVAFSPY